jgi:hypothetical protein
MRRWIGYCRETRNAELQFFRLDRGRLGDFDRGIAPWEPGAKGYPEEMVAHELGLRAREPDKPLLARDTKSNPLVTQSAVVCA